MPCFIKRPTRQTAEPIPITAEEFNRIAAAKDQLLRALMIEEKFVLVLENLIEFEEQLFALTLRRSITMHERWASFQEDIFTVNRRVVNLLAAFGLYRDQVPKDLVAIYGRDSAVGATFDDTREKERTDTFGFDIVETLRDHVMHRDFAVRELSFPGERHEEDGRITWRQRIEPRVRVADLLADRRISEGTKASLAKCEPIERITPWIRGYVDAIGRIHAALRTAMAADIKSWENELEAVLERGRERLGESAHGYVA
ncbi:MAG: hypothetical protein WD690_07170, partial [Vicinamibacterales bacterium]